MHVITDKKPMNYDRPSFTEDVLHEKDIRVLPIDYFNTSSLAPFVNHMVKFNHP